MTVKRLRRHRDSGGAFTSRSRDQRPHRLEPPPRQWLEGHRRRTATATGSTSRTRSAVTVPEQPHRRQRQRGLSSLQLLSGVARGGQCLPGQRHASSSTSSTPTTTSSSATRRTGGTQGLEMRFSSGNAFSYNVWAGSPLQYARERQRTTTRSSTSASRAASRWAMPRPAIAFELSSFSNPTGNCLTRRPPRTPRTSTRATSGPCSWDVVGTTALVTLDPLGEHARRRYRRR